MNADFACTQCGRCCHDLKLPLTVAEAIAWLAAGHEVQVLCEATRWADEPPADDRRAAHRRARSFAAACGALPVRVVATLAASFSGACPNLGAGMACGIYETRPLVCRVYPAEISPFIALQPAAKACPPEAWATDQPALMRGGVIVDAALRAAAQASRDADVAEAPLKQRVCGALGIHVAAVAGEGYAVHRPEPADLLRALRAAVEPSAAVPPAWQALTDRRATLATWRAARAELLTPAQVGQVASNRLEWLPLQA